ncbi:MAG: hypothetical protein NC040_05780 [Muribaculaceae bacterium]|nr:hypothetical protein [Alistipes senegalensis]MCM1473545.1 hypothetical protein [Muribaculaceae bacterium]
MEKRIFFYTKILILMFISVFCLVKTDITNISIYNAVERCINIIIPSLYAMMVIAPLLIRSGIIDSISRFTGKAGKFLFGMDNIVFPVFMFSMIAGYPTGVKMLSSAYEKGLIDKHRAEIFCGVCFGAGTAFISGCVTGQLYGNKSAGNLILISTIIADIIFAFIISFFMRKKCILKKQKNNIKITSDMLTECVTNGGNSIINICFMVMIFAVITAVLDYTGIISAAGKIISEITNLSVEDSKQIIRAVTDVTAVNEFSHGNYELLPYLSALISFGGICVIFQISAISGGLSLKPLIIERIIISVMSFIICRILSPVFLSGETIFTSSVNIRTHQAQSPVPSVMLIIMTFFLLSEYEKIRPFKKE